MAIYPSEPVMTISNFIHSTSSGQISNFKKGFTLIELMVVISITAVLGAIGIVGFVNYNQTQTMQNAANDLANTLNLAKSRALAHIKLGSACSAPNRILEGYNVEISISSNNYSLKSRCSGSMSGALNTKTLPQNVTFKTPDTSPTSFFFPINSFGSITSGQIVITGFNQNKTILVSPLGRISVQ